jgi:hypothetical protein
VLDRPGGIVLALLPDGGVTPWPLCPHGGAQGGAQQLLGGYGG